jgi:acetyl-CoA carboxylase biotin carboxyl carrier protein
MITSPIVATFYSAPSPDAPPFVKPGTKVKVGQTLCILEAMKMMNHLEAEFNCEIIETHVASGDLVEYGQNLFTVKKL